MALRFKGLTLKNSSAHSCRKLERVTGIEPAWPAWKAGALPLSYTRNYLREGLTLSASVGSCELDPLDFPLTPRGVA